MTDVVVLQVDLHPVDGAAEGVAATARVIVGDRRGVVLADVHRLVEREQVGNRLVDPGLPDRLAVDQQSAGAASPWPATVELELVLRGDLTSGERLLRGDVVSLGVKPVVAVLEDAVLDVQRPAAESASLKR